jgi:hypothetical protein
MVDMRRCGAAPLAHYFLYAIAAVSLTACGGVGVGGSGTTAAEVSSTPTTANDTLPANAPTIGGTPDTTDAAGTAYSFQPSASDSNGDALTFSIQNMPSWATFDASSGALTGTPTADQVGTYSSIIISVADGAATAQLPAFSIAVTAAPATPATPTDSPPKITGTPAVTVQAGAHYAFQPSASDPDKNPLVFSVSGQPAWASFNTSTGLLSGTPSSASIGTYSQIVVSVSDGTKMVSLPAFNIAVTAPPATVTNKPPKITGSPATSVVAGSNYSFSPAASDPDGNKLTFSISGKPSWATFSTTTGQMSGVPATGNVGQYTDIIISVSDGTNSVSLPAFAVTVKAPAAIPPTIGGTASTAAKVGVAYSFTPTASDPNGKALSFSIQNKPSWASFSIATGALTGTPAANDVGTDSSIVITASDGTASATLKAFTIAVAAATTTSNTVGTATVKWAAPTKNTDGSAISNLSGYVISYGNSAGSLAQTVAINNTTTYSYTIQNLGQGTWYFAVSTVLADGTQSAPSAVVSKTIQ